jgi:hypothetical protein
MGWKLLPRLGKFRLFIVLVIYLKAGLEKTQVLLKKPAGRLNAGFFLGKTGFFTENVHFWGPI